MARSVPPGRYPGKVAELDRRAFEGARLDVPAFGGPARVGSMAFIRALAARPGTVGYGCGTGPDGAEETASGASPPREDGVFATAAAIPMAQIGGAATWYFPYTWKKLPKALALRVGK